MQVDRQRLKERRLELGRSMRSVAQSAGVPLTTIKSLEVSGDCSYLTMNTLRLICDAVGLPMSGLLVGVRPPRADDGGPARQLVREVGAALFRYRDGISVDALAHALRCSADEVQIALVELDEALAGVGAMLHRTDSHVALAPAVAEILTPEVMRLAVEETATRPDLGVRDGVTIYQAMQGTRSAKGQRANADGLLRTGRLRNYGLLNEPEKETCPMLLSDEVRFSLMLDDRPGQTG